MKEVFSKVPLWTRKTKALQKLDGVDVLITTPDGKRFAYRLDLHCDDASPAKCTLMLTATRVKPGPVGVGQVASDSVFLNPQLGRLIRHKGPGHHRADFELKVPAKPARKTPRRKVASKTKTAPRARNPKSKRPK